MRNFLNSTWNSITTPVRCFGSQMARAQGWCSTKYGALEWKTGNGFFSSAWSSIRKALAGFGAAMFDRPVYGGMFILGVTTISLMGLPTWAYMLFSGGLWGWGLFLSAFIVAELIVHGVAFDHLLA